MSRKSNKPVVTVFSTEFCKALERVLVARCKDGSAVPRKTVVKELMKDSRFGISNQTMLTLMVGLAIRVGGVPGYKATRGRNGGIYQKSAPVTAAPETAAVPAA